MSDSRDRLDAATDVRRRRRDFLATVTLGASFVLLAACNRSDKPGSATTSSAIAPPATTTSEATMPAPPLEPGAGPRSPDASITWKALGLSTPDSVLHDEAADEYLVSNIDGQPLEADGKAFISRLSPNGAVVSLRWIQGGSNKVELNAPKGMAILGPHLYVADIDVVRIFERKTGAHVADVRIPGATFLNDVAVAPDGRVLVSDTGLSATAGGGLEPSDTDAVYAIDGDRKVTPLVDRRIGGPNGLVVAGDKIWVVSFGSGEIYSLDQGKAVEIHKLPKGSLDGVVQIGDEMLVSSWGASAIYRGRPGGPWTAVIRDVRSPGDIGYDTKRSRVLVPLSSEDEVRAYDLK